MIKRLVLFLAVWIFPMAPAWAADPAPASSQMTADGSMVSVSAKAGTATPYQNQSIQYTIRCVVRGSIFDLSLSDISVSSAIVEPQGKPVVHDQIENGVAVRVAEFRYIVTPLQPGKMTIPPVTLQGKFETPDLASVRGAFGENNSSGLRQILNFFSAFGGQTFSVTSNSTTLDVKAPAARLDPWLPLTSLKIIDDIDTSQAVRAGEPLTRKLTLLADGAAGSQLPDLESQQGDADFKVYADKPATGEDIDEKSGAILGWRKESYSLVALKPGRLVLPAIKLSWWDTVNNKIATTEVPERVLNILPGAAVQNAPAAGATARLAPAQPQHHAVPVQTGRLLLYGFFGMLAFGLLYALFRWVKRWRKDGRSEATALIVMPQKRNLGEPASGSVLKGALKKVRTAEELKDFLQAYACEHWGAAKNASLETIFAALSDSLPEPENEDATVIAREIAAALYGGKAANVEDLKRRCMRVMAALGKGIRGQGRRQKLPSLNPS